MKITIMGFSGSGKSTLARLLGEKYGLKILHLDKVQFMENWEERPALEKERIVLDFLDNNENWVIDGNYSKLYQERRIKESDLVIILAFNRFSALYRVVKRYFTYRGRTREDMGDGCIEKLDLEFIKWVLFDGRTKEKKDKLRKLYRENEKKTVIIRNQRDLDEFSKRGVKIF